MSEANGYWGVSDHPAKFFLSQTDSTHRRPSSDYIQPPILVRRKVDSRGHVFGSDLTCTHHGCETTWERHQGDPHHCAAVDRVEVSRFESVLLKWANGQTVNWIARQCTTPRRVVLTIIDSAKERVI